jgi:hypothetical protein
MVTIKELNDFINQFPESWEITSLIIPSTFGHRSEDSKEITITFNRPLKKSFGDTHDYAMDKRLEKDQS